MNDSQARIQAALDNVLAFQPCPRCGGKVTALPGTGIVEIVNPNAGMALSNQNKVVFASCEGCGWLAMHLTTPLHGL
jgi:hypothetical protein